MTTDALVGIVMGSSSDLDVMRGAGDALDEFGIGHTVEVMSAHRSPARVSEFAASAADNGYRVIIAGAGRAAHLPGVVAAHTPLPVIGVPIMSAHLGGADSLFSIVQMPSGVPVATVGLDAARNAGLLAVQMLATRDDDLLERYAAYKRELAAKAAASKRTVGFKPNPEGSSP